MPACTNININEIIFPLTTFFIKKIRQWVRRIELGRGREESRPMVIHQNLRTPKNAKNQGQACRPGLKDKLSAIQPEMGQNTFAPLALIFLRISCNFLH